MTAVRGRSLRIDVPEEAEGERLDIFLTRQLPGHTRSELRRLIVAARILVDGERPSKPGMGLRGGMVLELDLPEPAPSALVPEAIPVEVAYEDEHLVVVVKPAGLVVHPGHGRSSGTLVHALLGRGTSLASAPGPDRPGIVHRLDRETSGLLVVAKRDDVQRALAASFARRRVQKTYQAIVWGRPQPASGTIDQGIGRSSGDRTRMAVARTGGRPATTIYRTVELLHGFTRLEIDLVTGRTHQIRVHMTSRGCPVLGDTRYGGQPWKRLAGVRQREAIRDLGRLALHAESLAFEHPVAHTPLRFHAPLPQDLEQLLEVLRSAP